MKQLLACCLIGVLVACGGGITGPTSETVETVDSSTPHAAVPPAPLVEPVVDAPNGSFDGYIKPFAGWSVKNTSGGTSTITAYITSFDDQRTAIQHQTQVTGVGKWFEGTFNRTCVQIDLTYGGPGGRPFLFGFINHEGKVVGAHGVDRAACAPKRTPNPEPTPTPSPSPTPTPEPTPPPPVDLCPNIDGIQETVPEGQHINPQGNCVGQPVDLCSNIPGNQETVPEGYTVSDGICTQIPTPEPTPTPQPTPPPPPVLTCAQKVELFLNGPGPACVNLSGGQDNECAQVAQALDLPNGSLNGVTFDGVEAQVNNTFTWSIAANFAFVVDANECQGQPKAVRLQKGTQVGQPIPFSNADIDGNSATYCHCVN